MLPAWLVVVLCAVLLLVVAWNAMWLAASCYLHVCCLDYMEHYQFDSRRLRREIIRFYAYGVSCGLLCKDTSSTARTRITLETEMALERESIAQDPVNF